MGKRDTPLRGRIKVEGLTPILTFSPKGEGNCSFAFLGGVLDSGMAPQITLAPNIFCRCPKAQVWAPGSKDATQSVGTSTW